VRRTHERFLLAFLAARLALVLLTVTQPTGGVLTDSKGYLGLARALVRDGRYSTRPDGEPDLLRPPMYSSFLALVYLVRGLETPEITPVITLLQLGMSGLTAWLLVLLGRQTGEPRAGLAAGWLYALSPNVALWSLTVMTEVGFALMLTSTVLILAKAVRTPSMPWPVMAGFFLGVLAYLRPIAITLMPAWALMAFWWDRKTVRRARALASACLLMLAGASVVLPWVYRNWATYGQLTFSTATGKTWIGFNLAEVVAQAEGVSRNQAVAGLDPGEGLVPLTLSVFGRYPTTFVKAQALGVVRTLVGSDIGTWGNVLGDDNWSGLGLLSGAFWGSLDQAIAGLKTGADSTLLVRLALTLAALLHSVVLLSLAVLGAWLNPPHSQTGRFLSMLAVGTALVLLVTPGAAGQARFRVPVEPLLALLAGSGAVWAGARMRGLMAGRRALPGKEEPRVAASG
jgi:4-amino-4-deoxy-L-arabinose transferase-like glycosyltransferase